MKWSKTGIVAAFWVLGLAAHSQGAGTPPESPAPARNDRHVRLDELPPPKAFISRHRLSVHGVSLSYTATAGEIYIFNPDREPIASIFSFAYVKDGPVSPSRPVLFLFNGGPGASSLWLQMTVLGPKRIKLDHDVNPSAVPPFGVEDNMNSPLDVCDLVFIDPVGTGFSHAIGNAKDSDFYGVDSDADSIALFVEAWLTKNHRWNAPKYLLGESYGGIRAQILPRALMGGIDYIGLMRGITVNGVIIASVAVSHRENTDVGVDAPNRATLLLPSLAIAARYHHRIVQTDQTTAVFYEEVKAFASREYAEALALQAGDALSQDERMEIARKLQAYTGISAEDWVRNGLKLSADMFSKKILADRQLDIGLYDSRYTLSNAHSGGDFVADDPAMTQFVPGYIASFHAFIADDLKVEMPYPYEAIVFGRIFDNWKYERAGVAGEAPGDYTADLATAMRRNPHLKVLVASGYYDMLTPAAEAESLFSHHLPRNRVTFKHYQSGHTMSAPAFADDVRNFVKAADESPR